MDPRFGRTAVAAPFGLGHQPRRSGCTNPSGRAAQRLTEIAQAAAPGTGWAPRNELRARVAFR